jgi:hypothetical protein
MSLFSVGKELLIHYELQNSASLGTSLPAFNLTLVSWGEVNTCENSSSYFMADNYDTHKLLFLI